MLSRKDHGDRAGESPQHIDRSARTEQTHASDVGDTRCATPRAVPAPSTRLFLLLHDGYAADGVTDDLMPDDDLDGIGSRVAANLDDNDRLDGFEPGVRRRHTDELGRINTRNLIFDGPTGDDVAVGDAVFAPIGLELDGGARRGILAVMAERTARRGSSGRIGFGGLSRRSGRTQRDGIGSYERYSWRSAARMVAGDGRSA